MKDIGLVYTEKCVECQAVSAPLTFLFSGLHMCKYTYFLFYYYYYYFFLNAEGTGHDGNCYLQL